MCVILIGSLLLTPVEACSWQGDLEEPGWFGQLQGAEDGYWGQGERGALGDPAVGGGRRLRPEAELGVGERITGLRLRQQPYQPGSTGPRSKTRGYDRRSVHNNERRPIRPDSG